MTKNSYYNHLKNNSVKLNKSKNITLYINITSDFIIDHILFEVKNISFINCDKNTIMD